VAGVCVGCCCGNDGPEWMAAADKVVGMHATHRKKQVKEGRTRPKIEWSWASGG